MTATSAPLVVAVGAINWDVTLFVESLPMPGQEVIVSDTARVPGGTAANVAVAAARLLNTGDVAFMGALGDDAIAERQREILHAEGVRTDAIVTIPGAESGQAFILVDANGQNVIASALGANALLAADHLREPGMADMLREARICAITDPPLSVIEEILTITQATDCRVSWDPGVRAADREAVWPLARRVDNLLVNEDETQSLFGEITPLTIGRRLKAEGWANRVILKQGGAGAVILDLGTGKLIAVPPLPLAELGLQLVSSVGAGDAFHGALTALSADNRDDIEALRGAAADAAINVSRPGTRGAPSSDELAQALAVWHEHGDVIKTDTL